MPPSGSLCVWGRPTPQASRIRDAAGVTLSARLPKNSCARAYPRGSMGAVDVESPSCAARGHRHCGGALHAADAADPAWRVGRPDRQNPTSDDRARVCHFIFGNRFAVERDHPDFRFRSQQPADGRGDPARWLWRAGDLAGGARLGGLTNAAAGSAASRQGNLGGFVLGTTLGLVWTPCAGPVLGSILTVVATSKDTAWASTQLVVYAIGAAIPMLAIAYGGQAVTTRVRSIARISPRLQQGFGVVVIAFAALSYFQYDTLIVAWLTAFYPQAQLGL